MGISYINPYPGENSDDSTNNDPGQNFPGTGEDDYIREEPSINIYLKELNDHIEVKLDVDSYGNKITEYEIWSSYDNQDYNRIKIIPIDRYNENNSVFVFKDFSYNKKGEIFYKVYAVNSGERYKPFIRSTMIEGDVADPEFINVSALSEMFEIKVDIPDDRRLSHVEIYHHSSELENNLSEENSSLIYSGLSANIFYAFKEYEKDYYHKFWAKSITKTK